MQFPEPRRATGMAEIIATFVVALGVPLWLAVEALTHTSGREVVARRAARVRRAPAAASVRLQRRTA